MEEIAFDDSAREAALEAVHHVETKLPVPSQVLKAKDRRGRRTVGPRRIGFVTEAVRGVTLFPQVLPATFPRDQYLTQGNVLSNLQAVKARLLSSVQRIDGLITVVSESLMKRTDKVYAYFQDAEGDADIDAFFKGLQAYYDRGSDDNGDSPDSDSHV